jgi:pimeloyl-ACP methyl ester carboxylesterase
MTDPKPRQLCWEVHGLKLEGMSWGDEALPPLLALHGWLDNAASFAVLAPLIKTHYVVALDLTGHGRSSWRSQDATYQIWDDLPEVMAVIDQLGWDTFDLMGHSRGAIISTLLASAIPERVNHLVLLDALTTEGIEEEEFSAQLVKFLVDKPRRLNKEGRVYASFEQAIAARTKVGLSADAARLLAQRSLSNKGEGFVWDSDARLWGPSAVKLTKGQNRAVLEGLSMPTLYLQAEDGLVKAPAVMERAQRYIPVLQAEVVPGGHHFHMEGDVSAVADRITRFLRP